MQENKRKALEKVMNKLKDKNPEINLGFNNIEPTEYIKTPFVTLNALNGGGIPRGKFGAIAGASATAKSTLLEQIVGYNHQIDKDFTVLWTDAEDSIDLVWLEKLGVDPQRVIIQKSDPTRPYMEALLEDALELIKTRAIDMWIIDSISALEPKEDSSKLIEENVMMTLPRKLGQFFRKAVKVVSPNKGWPGCAVVFIGQVYSVPTTSSVGLEEVRGGNAFKHWMHWRWKTRRGNKDEGPDEIKIQLPDGRVGKIRPGWAQHVKLDKTKLNSKEGQEVILQFVLGRGLDSVNSQITALIANEVVERNGPMYTHQLLPDGKIRGRDALIEFLRTNDQVRNELTKEMDKLLTERNLDQVDDHTEIEIED